jgi:hypothetical protein
MAGRFRLVMDSVECARIGSCMRNVLDFALLRLVFNNGVGRPRFSVE